jgi:hypothetical protein
VNALDNPLKETVNQIMGSGSMSITRSPASSANRLDGGVTKAASTRPSRTQVHSAGGLFVLGSFSPTGSMLPFL